MNAAAMELVRDAADKVVRIRNGALTGARAMLLTQQARTRPEQAAAHTEHTEPTEREPDSQCL